MKCCKKRIAIIRPIVPHYHEEFYRSLQESYKIRIFSRFDQNQSEKEGFKTAGLEYCKLENLKIGPMIFYNPFPFLFGKYDVIVLVQQMSYISHWLILLFARFFKKKVLLWGHGITVPKYISHEKNMPLSRKMMFWLSDGAWFYTKKEQALWKRLLPSLRSVALGNTISNVNRILNIDCDVDKTSIKSKYSITENKIFIFCARFNSAYRRGDILVKLIESLDSKEFGFVIIGEGLYKPDFNSYPNVYDFGAVYDEKTKDDLFTLSDLYYQPAWIGLSIVEAMAYGKPILTFQRSKNILQGVEFEYVEHGYNGMIFDDTESMIKYIENAKIEDIAQLGTQARKYVKENLSMENMVKNAVQGLERVTEKP